MVCTEKERNRKEGEERERDTRDSGRALQCPSGDLSWGKRKLETRRSELRSGEFYREKRLMKRALQSSSLS